MIFTEKKISPFIIENERSINIDNYQGLNLARAIAKKKLLALEKINISVKLYSELKKYFIIKKNNKKNFVKLNEYDAVFTKFNYFIDKDFLSKTPNLKYIISNVTGLDQIDTYLTKKKYKNF